MKYCGFLILLIFSTYANASYHFCKGKISTAWTEGDGDVYIVGTWRGAHTQICNVNNVWKGVEPEACKVWVSSVQLAYVAKSDVTVRYSGSAIDSCASAPTYGATPAPNYVMITKH